VMRASRQRRFVRRVLGRYGPRLDVTTGTPSGVTSFVGTYAPVIVADALFFGNSLTRSYYRFSPSYALNWLTTAFTGTTTLAANVVVAKGWH